jgi:hypothetical protein
MKVGVMITNGGKHPPEKFATECAGQIASLIEVDEAEVAKAHPDMTGEQVKDRVFELNALRAEFEGRLMRAFRDHFKAIEAFELAALAAHGLDRLKHPLDVSADFKNFDDPVSDFVAAAAGTLLADWAATPAVQDVVRRTVAAHFHTNVDMHRSHHADAHGHHPVARAYRTARHHHGAAHVHAHIDRHLAPPAASAPA